MRERKKERERERKKNSAIMPKWVNAGFQPPLTSHTLTSIAAHTHTHTRHTHTNTGGFLTSNTDRPSPHLSPNPHSRGGIELIKGGVLFSTTTTPGQDSHGFSSISICSLSLSLSFSLREFYSPLNTGKGIGGLFRLGREKRVEF